MALFSGLCQVSVNPRASSTAPFCFCRVANSCFALGPFTCSSARISGPLAFVSEFHSDTICRFLLIEGLEIRGNKREGTGLSIKCIGNGRYIYNFCLRDIVVENCGGEGLSMIGNIFEGQIFNSYFRDNSKNGAILVSIIPAMIGSLPGTGLGVKS